MKKTVSYDLSKTEQKAFREFMEGKLSCRDAARYMKISHQQVINLTSAVVRQWIQDGVLKFTGNADVAYTKAFKKSL